MHFLVLEDVLKAFGNLPEYESVDFSLGVRTQISIVGADVEQLRQFVSRTIGICNALLLGKSVVYCHVRGCFDCFH